MLKSKKRIIWIGILIVAVVSSYFVFTKKDEETVYVTADVAKSNLSQTVSSTGDLTDEREITLNFEIGGRIGKIFVKEGQVVAAGDPIAMIDNPILSLQVEQAKANFDLAIAKAGGSNDAIREAKISVDNAKKVLDDTEDLNDKNISAADSAEDDAKQYLEDAQSYYDQVVSESGASSATAKSAWLTVRSAEKSYNAAQEAKAVAEKQAALSETNAENSLATVQSRLETLKSGFTQNSNDASIIVAKTSYDMALENMSKATLKSSVNGTITRINNKVGEILGTGVIKESFTKVITNDFILESNIAESDIVKISLGDKADVTFDALKSDDIFQAEVVQIDTDATLIQDVVYYRIKLRLVTTDQRLKPGMSSNIDIKTAEKKEVLIIPMRAIKIEDNRKYVEVLNEKGLVKKVFVEIGLEGDDGMVEILSGLNGDEKVVTFINTKTENK